MPPVVTPIKVARKGVKPPRNKLELSSPNGRAKCHRCGAKIVKGTPRACLLEKNDYGSSPRYYHRDCLTLAERSKLPKPAKQAEQERIDERVSRDPDLRDQLKRLRRKLRVEEAYKEDCQVFPNATLDELVMFKPTTMEGLENIKGIGDKRLEIFGEAILKVTRQYADNTAIALDLDVEEVAAGNVKREEEDDDDILEVYDGPNVVRLL